jgi:hypothetical protein
MTDLKGNRESTAELVRDATDQLSRLISDEMALARAELTAKGRQAGLGAGMLGAAGLTALYGVAALLATVVLALDTAMPGWLAALIMAVVLLAGAGALALLGRTRVKQAGPPVPEETVQSVKADIDEVKGRARR